MEKDWNPNASGITRSRFLATSALAVGAAACGGKSGEAGEPEESATTAPADSPPVGAQVSYWWIISASRVNTFWTQILPRIAAASWTDKTSILGWKNDQFLAATRPDGGQFGEWKGSCKFLEKLRDFNTYLGGTRPVPIRVIADGDWHLVLTGNGLDVTIPRLPNDLKTLLREFRDCPVPDRSIGVPFYPSVPFATPATIVKPGVLPLAFDGSLDLENRLARMGLRSQSTVQVDSRGLVLLTMSEYLRLLESEGEGGWQVPAQAFSGIMDELPRKVADIWIEQIEGGTSLLDTFKDPERLRTLFDKIQPRLPDRMTFRQWDGTDGIPNTDVMITNDGFYFPPVRELPEDPMRAIYLAMRAGDAGNPIFTDSQRTE